LTGLKSALGASLVQVRAAEPLHISPEQKDGPTSASRYIFKIDDREYDVVLDLWAELAAFALFRKRDSLLLHTLKSKALTWVKTNRVKYLDVLPSLGSTVMFSFLVNVFERDSVALLTQSQVAGDLSIPADLAVGVDPSRVTKARGLFGLKSLASKWLGSTLPARVVQQ
jgi:hypothetical protein